MKDWLTDIKDVQILSSKQFYVLVFLSVCVLLWQQQRSALWEGAWWRLHVPFQLQRAQRGPSSTSGLPCSEDDAASDLSHVAYNAPAAQ